MGSCKETRTYDSTFFLVQNEHGIQNELGKYSDGNEDEYRTVGKASEKDR
mgnify:CR=1 FL=1